VKDIKTEKWKKINKKTLIVAFDIAQEKQVVYIRYRDWQFFKYGDTGRGIAIYRSEDVR